MTGRRRHSGGSHHSPSTSHTPHRRQDGGDGGDPSRRTGGQGGGGISGNLDAIDTMAGRLDATRAKVEGVGTMVRSINVGPQSMGIVGSGFTGAAQAHLQTAQQHVARTTRAVEQAQAGTRGTAAAYRNTDATNAANLARIDTTTRPPTVNSTSGTTSPAGTTSSGTLTAPPTTHGGPPGGPGSGGPPGGGGTPPTPPGGGTGGPGGHGTPGGPPQHRESWRDTIKRNFTREEYHRLQKALHKMAQDPSEPGRVAGSGALTPKERELVARAQKLVTVEADTPMRKVIPPGDVAKYLSGRYDSIGGFVSRAQDGGHLSTPDDIVRGNRLDYYNSPFGPGMSEVHVIEFPATDPGRYQTPLGAPQDLHTNLPENSPAVRRATDDMMDAAEAAGLDPSTYQRYIADWPYSGIGVTADGDIGIPERRMTDRMPIPDGSVMYKYDASGVATPVATYHKGLGWVTH
ncbi:MAG TPA: hypothetical protein VGX25_00900 [Actinophytocola sp.]|uniref:WXG100 family type VII secretion target n=1 Tax=Actinophytocola sp. TaxID=1872138 RepID=UPI002DDC91E2|nr:hypothetical protein [Actinophytocola sp.]HEV2777934.1 hypothetical protein [Actinophytocola sp.]